MKVRAKEAERKVRGGERRMAKSGKGSKMRMRKCGIVTKMKGTRERIRGRKREGKRKAVRNLTSMT